MKLQFFLLRGGGGEGITWTQGIRSIFVVIQPKSYDRFFPHPPPPPLQMVNNDLLWKLQSCQAGGTFFFFLARSAFAPAYLLKSCVSVPFVLHVF